MNLPNEVALLILGLLPQQDLKRTRLACKDLASLGGQLLVGTLHISPRDDDMDVFDRITQHPDLSKSVKNLFFDTARFCKYDSMFDYCRDLRSQLLLYDYRQLRKYNSAVRKFTRVVRGPKARRGEPFDKTDVERCCGNRTFNDGYQEYCRLAEQQQNLVSPSLFQRVLDGLRAVGPLHAVTIGSTFEIRLEPDAEPEKDNPENATVYDVPEEHWPKRYDGNRDNVTSRASCIQLSVDDLIAGRRSVGSPIARAWPFTSLQPKATELMLIQDYANNQDPVGNGIFDGSAPFVLVLQVLSMAKKWPTSFGLMATGYPETGLPSHLFGMQWPCDMPSLDVGNRLTVLRLRFSGTLVLDDLDRLKPLFHDSSRLEELTLDFPAHDELIVSKYYDFSRVFPPVTEWSLFKLRCLNLRGLRVSTRDLLGLLLVSLPNMKELELASIDLIDGKWIHVVEGGLRTQTSLERCTLWGNTLWSDCYSGPPSPVMDKAHRRCLVRVLRALGELYTLYKHECKAKDRCSRIIDQIRDTLRTNSANGDMEGSEEESSDDDEVDDDDDDDDDEEDNEYYDDDYGGYFDMGGWESNDENIMAAIMQSSHQDTSSDDESE
ncbi:MAG: hypothetical protein Q9208_003993 [Pyrenodesmia sp. 3 TL-2023]